MITSQKSDALGILQLKAEQKLESFCWIVSTIDVIASKNVASVWYLATYFKQFEQVVELAMNIPAYCDWSIYRLHIGFLDQDFFYFFAKYSNVSFG